MTSGGFFRTGDVDKILEEGAVKIVDSLKDMLIVSGFNVYPKEVEDILGRHLNILEAAVVGEPDEKTGKRVHAYIVTSGDINVREAIEFCHKELTAYKIPKQMTILDELPKSTVGKILRRELCK
jgi:long-chain acyl-CoA synthetase